ncbi:MAG: cupin domain-containing protein [Roseicyclus sp.]|nr:cupin domain-containing protein [Roseicyclus sp.]
MHVHDKANQLFFVLDGTLTIEVDGRTDRLGPSDGLNVRPGQIHQA